MKNNVESTTTITLDEFIKNCSSQNRLHVSVGSHTANSSADRFEKVLSTIDITCHNMDAMVLGPKRKIISFGSDPGESCSYDLSLNLPNDIRIKHTIMIETHPIRGPKRHHEYELRWENESAFITYDVGLPS